MGRAWVSGCWSNAFWGVNLGRAQRMVGMALIKASIFEVMAPSSV